ncbi:SIT4 phosphatase-associated protein-domain-containing protein [Zopfochytrium polystomum]|nr:SIT4 phosphatase-associated protein-domain-containing protein [Zopfochytrium polystomum]
MFWRFGLQSAAAIDSLLEKDTVTLEELFEVEELLQECKAHNSKLIDILSKPENLKTLLLLLTSDDLEESKKFKYPYLACEVISCEILFFRRFGRFWTVQVQLIPCKRGYFSKVNGILIQKKVVEMLAFIRRQPNVVERMLRHMANASIAELLLKIISVEELPDGQGIISVHNTASQTILDVIAVSYQNIAALEAAIAAGEAISMDGSTSLVDQLKSADMMKKLADYMVDKESPNATSTLANGINIIIELIRRYCSEIEQAEYQQHQFQQQLISSPTGEALPTDQKLHQLATDLNNLLQVICERVEEMAVLLENPRTMPPFSTLSGDVVPLGSERLKTCELIAEILHLQYLYFSSPLFERLVSASTTSKPLAASHSSVDELAEALTRLRLSNQPNVADELVALTDKFKLFFEFPWNNFLHSVVYDMIAKVFNTYSYTSTTSYARPPEQGEDFPPASPPGGTLDVKMKGVQASFKMLVSSILIDGELSAKIIDAQKRNDEGEKLPRGTRLGFMGHLTYIADEVCKLIEKCGADFEVEGGAPNIVHPEWDAYVNGGLQETKERDRQLLGGTRPTQLEQLPMDQMNPEAMDALPLPDAGDDGGGGGVRSGDESPPLPSADVVVGVGEDPAAATGGATVASAATAQRS